jgi:hypothetical protein
MLNRLGASDGVSDRMPHMNGDHVGRVVACSVVLCFLAGAPKAMGQAHVLWDPLYAKPPYDRMEWTLTVRELSNQRSYYYWAFQDGFVGGGVFYFGLQPYGGCPVKKSNCKVALFSFSGPVPPLHPPTAVREPTTARA